MIIKSDNIFLEDSIISGYITIENDKIINISSTCDSNYLDFSSCKVLAGFIDIHVHGGNGYDTMMGTYEALDKISNFKVLEGVTSFCPTTVTDSNDKTIKAIKNVKDVIAKGVSGSKIIGTFLEGPFISKKYKGAHPDNYIIDIDINLIKQYIKAGEGTIKSVAIAPEIQNAKMAIEYLTKNNINVRIGHSDATFDEASSSIQKGANIAIHTYNAMRPLSHKEAGIIGSVFTNDNIYNELICDLIHVNKPAIEILLRCKKDNIILITDCVMAGGMGDGKYELGALDVFVKDGIATLADNTLAGSTLTLLKSFQNMCNVLNVDLLSVSKMVTKNPAKALGIDGLGSITIGNKADFTILNNDLTLKQVIIDGKTKI